jgi:hypothetical protein
VFQRNLRLFTDTKLELSVLQCLKASSRFLCAGYTKHTKNPYTLHDYSVRPTSKCLQTFLLLPTSALFPIENEKWKFTSVIFPKRAWGAWNVRVQIGTKGQHNVSLWNWISSLQTWAKIVPVPSAMVIPLNPHLRRTIHHTVLDSFILYLQTVTGELTASPEISTQFAQRFSRIETDIRFILRILTIKRRCFLTKISVRFTCFVIGGIYHRSI